MNSNAKQLLGCCLYYTANSLSRTITCMAEAEFSKLGMTPSHAFLLIVAIDEPGISQKVLADRLNLAQSTVSRFADALVLRGFIEKKAVGKVAHVYPTEKGKAQLEEINGAWTALFERYSEILGEEESRELTALIGEAYRKLEED